MNKPIYDVHLEVWQATAETHQGQLYRCLPSLESEYRERGLAAGKVVSAIEHYKAICTRTPADVPPAEAAMFYGSPAPAIAQQSQEHQDRNDKATRFPQKSPMVGTAPTWSKGPWVWEERRTEDGRHVATLLVTKHRPVPCDDTIIFALREDWIGPMCEGRQQAKQLVKSAPDMLQALRTIANQSIGDDWTAEQAIAFIKQHAREAILVATSAE